MPPTGSCRCTALELPGAGTWSRRRRGQPLRLIQKGTWLVIFSRDISILALWSLAQPQRRVNAAQQPGTAILFPLFVFLLSLTILYIRLTHSLPLILSSYIFKWGTPMAGLFWIQLRALIWKNWIVLSKHWFVSVHPFLVEFSSNFFQLNLIRCLILPIAYGAFLANAQLFFQKPNNVRYSVLTVKLLPSYFD